MLQQVPLLLVAPPALVPVLALLARLLMSLKLLPRRAIAAAVVPSQLLMQLQVQLQTAVAARRTQMVLLIWARGHQS